MPDVTTPAQAAAQTGLATSTAEMADAVRAAREARTSVRIAGTGSWLDAGRPVTASVLLQTTGLRGIVDYVPGDLTITALAGTPLSELHRATRAEAQWLPLDPYGRQDGTLGATLATASAGPLALSMGTPRDVVLGLDAVLGTAETIAAGGRVVKNVAGFDLVRLLIGAWGTLGVITQATIRLRARPEVDMTLALAVPHDSHLFPSWLDRIRALPLVPAALELIDAAVAARIGLEARALLLVRFTGNAPLVEAQRRVLGASADVEQYASGAELWRGLTTMEPAGAPCMRWSARPSRFADLWVAAARTAVPGSATHGTPGRGLVRQYASPATPPDALRATWEEMATRIGATGDRTTRRATAIAERLPAALWPVLARTAAADAISRGVRTAFDPNHLLNPGILGEPANDLPSGTASHD